MTDTIKIRPATLADLDSIRDCAAQAYAPYVARIGKKPAPMVADFQTSIEHGQLDVLETEGSVAGFIVHYPQPAAGHLHIENVAVLPRYHGKGFGSRLLAHGENAAKTLGFSTVELYTNEKMTENLTYYPAKGYREIDRRSEAGFNRVFFRKEL